jgi:hypothetical protein
MKEDYIYKICTALNFYVHRCKNFNVEVTVIHSTRRLFPFAIYYHLKPSRDDSGAPSSQSVLCAAQLLAEKYH